MFKRYHIEVVEAPPKVELPPKYLVKRYNNCTYVQECTIICIYNVHRPSEDGTVAEPISKLCRGCHLCSLACPKAALSVEFNPEFLKLGNSYFTPERIEQIYFEAETGRVPVSGAGYGGPFAGRGFDSIWFDFSEIVRPTRDGIHGREYISTSVDLGRRPSYLEFDERGRLLTDFPLNIEIPLPILFNTPTPCATNRWLQLSLAKAASILKTFSFVRAENLGEDLMRYKQWLIPRIPAEYIDEYVDPIKETRIVEIDCRGKEDFGDIVETVRNSNPSILVSFHLPYCSEAGEIAEELVDGGADLIHFYADEREVEKDPEYIVRAIRSVHIRLVDRGVRDQVTFISSGGVAEAAHVPKSIQLGADVVAIGLAYQVALGCRVCNGEREDLCPLKVGENDVDWAAQRIINMVASWRDQLLEVLGGMGMREVRRLRGEVGRAMFYHELERKIFGGGDYAEINLET